MTLTGFLLELVARCRLLVRCEYVRLVLSLSVFSVPFHKENSPSAVSSIAFGSSLASFTGTCWATSSISFADRRSVRADSTGPKTFFLSFWLLFLRELARALLAILCVCVGVVVAA